MTDAEQNRIEARREAERCHPEAFKPSVRYGLPMTRLMQSTEKTPTCWLWRGRIQKPNPKHPANLCYGMIHVGHRSIMVHRLSYIIHRGKIPDNAFVLHSCDNAICVNPAHLFLGSHTDNMRDASNKGRLMRGIDFPLAKLSDDKVRYIRANCKPGHSEFGISALSRRMGVSYATLSAGFHGRKWKHVKTKPDYTCAWQECTDCDFKTDPA